MGGETTPPVGKRRRRFRRRTKLAIVAVAIGLYSALGGCVSTVTSPAQPVSDPTQIYVRFDKLHKGLILPTDRGGHVEYGYGEYRWYALKQDRWYNLFSALFVPSQGTLGRRKLLAGDPAALAAAYPNSQLYSLTVSRSAIRRLSEKLEAAYEKNARGEIYNRVYRLYFVESDDSYWLLGNCNDAVARWLGELDCSVSFVPIRLGLDITEE